MFNYVEITFIVIGSVFAIGLISLCIIKIKKYNDINKLSLPI